MRNTKDLTPVLQPALEDAVRWGASVQASELLIIARPWGFKLEEILMEVALALWYGQEDDQCPPAVGKLFARIIPNASFGVCVVDGHFVLFRQWEQILRDLVTAS